MNQIKKELQEYFKGFLCPQTPLSEWATTHDLSLEPVECPFCGSKLNPAIPFATSTMRGIIYDQCQCDDYPSHQAPFLYGAADPAERNRDRDFARSIFEYL